MRLPPALPSPLARLRNHCRSESRVAASPPVDDRLSNLAQMSLAVAPAPVPAPPGSAKLGCRRLSAAEEVRAASAAAATKTSAASVAAAASAAAASAA